MVSISSYDLSYDLRGGNSSYDLRGASGGFSYPPSRGANLEMSNYIGKLLKGRVYGYGEEVPTFHTTKRVMLLCLIWLDVCLVLKLITNGGDGWGRTRGGPCGLNLSFGYDKYIAKIRCPF